MTRVLALLLIGFAFGGGLGFVLGASGGDDTTGAPPMEHAQHAHAHGEPLMLPEGEGAPELQVAVFPDPVSGWNLNIRTTDFRFAAERAGGDHVAGEGHAHIYVNGTKIARAYGDWFHLDDLPSGRIEVEVTLNSNDHRALVVGETPLSAVVGFDNSGQGQ